MEVIGATAPLPPWEPEPRNEPQVKAYHSTADILLYGGKPFGGKSDLQCGLARYAHTNSLLLRRAFPELESGLIARSLEFYGPRKLYNASKHIWTINKKTVRFGYGEKHKDFKQYKGPNWDYIGIDEASEIPRFDDGTTPIDMLIPWNRTTINEQPVRMVLTTNPGGVGEEWLMEWFEPWLEGGVEDGELRYVERDERGKLVFYDNPVDGRDLKSITFIASSWKDNPYAASDYEENLRLLPEAMQLALLKGLWGTTGGDDIWQVIPTAWIRAAQDRWTPESRPATAGGLDVAHGGLDKTVLSLRAGSWFAPLQRWDGRDTPDGRTAAKLVQPLVSFRFPLLVDTFGFGADCYGELRSLNIHWAKAHFGNEKTDAKEINGKLGFSNDRAEAVWRMREALDPTNGADLALPPDRKILVDLCSFKWKQHPKGIAVESKADIIKRIGRSPDDGDAIIMCWFAGYSDIAKSIKAMTEGENKDLKRRYDRKY